MDDFLPVAIRLHRYLKSTHWDGKGLAGPDFGIRFNWRIGRFVKSYLSAIPWSDSYYYLQAQGYWVLANWRLFYSTGDPAYREIALRCSEHMLDIQRPDGAWDYPNIEWRGRVATAECTWACLGLLDSYRYTSDIRYLKSGLSWHRFLLEKVGFTRMGEELAVNYFAECETSRVPNNSAFVLRFLAELADLTGDRIFLRPADGMIAFLRNVQMPYGEFPYSTPGTEPRAKSWGHFQCYQYNAFECLDLMKYFELTGDGALPALIRSCARFLLGGLAEDGQAYYDCTNRSRHITYHAAAVGAVFAEAARLGFLNRPDLAERAFSYLSRMQREDGGFPASSKEYWVMADRRSYPRAQAMMLFHFLSASASPAAQRAGVAS